ncbi:MAG: hypothetical protein AB1832_02190 [Pseudomonadota bacterium]
MKQTVAILGGLLLAGCASFPPVVSHPARDTPARFDVLDPTTGGARANDPAPICESPLVDPRNGITLTLIRSTDGHGDYLPARPGYGLAGNELLRIDCTSGTPMGAVPR